MTECDDITVNNRDLEFNQPWLNFSIPSDSDYKKCYRYAPTAAAALSNGTGQCAADAFNTTHTIKCNEFVYASDERNVQTEVLFKTN